MKFKRLIAALTLFLPYITGFLFGAGYHTGVPSYEDLERYTGFLLLFGAWNLLELYILLYLEQSVLYSKGITKRPATALGLFWNLSWLAALSAFLLTTLIMIRFNRTRNQSQIFYLMIILLPVGTFCRFNMRRLRYELATLLSVIYTSGISFLSFLLVTYHWSWQALWVSFAFSLLFAARSLAGLFIRSGELIKRYGSSKEKFKRKVNVISKTYTALLLIGPVLVAALCFLKQLPGNYIISLGIIPAVPRLKQEIEALSVTLGKKREPAKKKANQLLTESTALIALFALLISLLQVFL